MPPYAHVVKGPLFPHRSPRGSSRHAGNTALGSAGTGSGYTSRFRQIRPGFLCRAQSLRTPHEGAHQPGAPLFPAARCPLPLSFFPSSRLDSTRAGLDKISWGNFHGDGVSARMLYNSTIYIAVSKNTIAKICQNPCHATPRLRLRMVRTLIEAFM